MNWFLLAWHRLFFFLRFQRIHRDQRVVRQTEVFLGDGSQNDENCKVVWLWYNYNPNVVGSVSGEVSISSPHFLWKVYLQVQTILYYTILFPGPWWFFSSIPFLVIQWVGNYPLGIHQHWKSPEFKMLLFLVHDGILSSKYICSIPLIHYIDR